MNPGELLRIKALGLTTYRRPKCANRWHLPVCSTKVREKLLALRPNHPKNWEEIDFGGCPTLCYVLNGRDIKAWSKLQFTAVWAQFEDRIGKGPAKEFFRDLWIRNNNILAHNRNTWERRHGGIRGDRFNRGMGVRAAASMSIT